MMAALGYFSVVVTYQWLPHGFYDYQASDNYFHFTISGFVGVTGVTVVMSLLMALTVEKPLERIRHAWVAKMWG